MRWQIPTLDVPTVTKKSQINKDYVKANMGLPTIILDNRMGRTGFTHENAVDFWPEMDNWKAEHEHSHVRIPVKSQCKKQCSIDYANYMPKQNVQPLFFEGWAMSVKWVDAFVYPKYAVFQESNCLHFPKSGYCTGDAIISLPLSNPPISLEDPRIIRKSLYSGLARVQVVGALEPDEWKAVGFYPKPGIKGPCGFNDVVTLEKTCHLERVPEDIILDIPDAKVVAFEENGKVLFQMNSAEILKLPSDKISHFQTPIDLVPDKNPEFIRTQSHISEDFVIMDINQAKNSGLKASQIYWIGDVVGIHPCDILTWPQLRTPCKVRNRQGIISENLILEPDLERVDQKKNEDSKIYVFKDGNTAKYQGVLNTKAANSRKTQLDHITTLIKQNPAVEKELGKLQNTDDTTLNNYLQAIQVILDGQYIKIHYSDPLRWLLDAVPTAPHHSFGLITLDEIKDLYQSPSKLPEDILLSLYIRGTSEEQIKLRPILSTRLEKILGSTSTTH